MTETPLAPLRVAIFASGRGSNLRALLRARASGRLPLADIRLVFSNNPGAPALDLAAEAGVRSVCIDHRPYRRDRGAHEAAILEVLRSEGIELVVLAGYMRLLTPLLINAFPGRMINIHPSLLPAFPGVHAQRQAVEYGVRYSGCTVHLVTNEMDAGPIILQRVVPVLSDDDEESLASRILEEEHKALPLALDLFSRRRIRVEGRQVAVLPGTSSFPELEGIPLAYRSVVLATGNTHKTREIKSILSEVALRFRTPLEYPGAQEPEESAPDYLGNARIKAEYWQKRTGLWALADDSGLEVEALGGRPGIHSSRYAPNNDARLAKLLQELEGVPMEKRRARFVCTVVLRGPGGEEFHETGICEGHIDFQARGVGGFGYDPLFIPDGFGERTLAEIPERVKNNISHRARALFALKGVLMQLSRGEIG